MHDDSELAGDSDSCPLEADLLTQLQPPCAQTVLSQILIEDSESLRVVVSCREDFELLAK